MFRRRRKVTGQDAGSGNGDGTPDVEADIGGSDAEPRVDTAVPADRPDGPWDEAEAAPDMPRLDLGAVRVPATPELEVELEVQDDEVVAVTVTQQGVAVQLQAFAAPKSGGLWEEARAEIFRELTAGSGPVTEVEGPFGGELYTELPDQSGEPGSAQRQSARFVGVEGPRWLLRGVFVVSAGLDPEHAQSLEWVLRGTVVVRGQEPMPPRARLPLRFPPELAHSADTGESGGGDSAVVG